MLILGISGKAGVGKTTLANHLCAMDVSRKMSFADPLRDEVCSNFEFNREDTHNKDTKYLLAGRLMSMREILQWWGETMRRANPYYWANISKEKLIDTKEGEGFDGVVIFDDVRYLNEVKMICSMEDFGCETIIIRILPYPEWEEGPHGKHVSETQLDFYEGWDGVFSPAYGSLLDTAQEVRKLWR